MSKNILLIFEGKKTEPQIFKNIQNVFPKKENNTVFYATYNTNIYMLYEELNKNPNFDLIEIIRNKNDNNKTNLKSIIRKDISLIYLFFDYDNHVRMASNDKINEMLEYFNEETENGKLYISYPMVESLKHIKKNNDKCLYNLCVYPTNKNMDLPPNYSQLVKPPKI